jgi:hypothetical protein
LVKVTEGAGGLGAGAAVALLPLAMFLQNKLPMSVVSLCILLMHVITKSS